jgi:Fe-S-cluster containining protein
MSLEKKLILDLRRMIPHTTGCPKGCADCCGMVPFSRYEASRVPQRVAKGTTCPYLENGRCSVYESRPILCRIFPYGMPLARQCRHSHELSAIAARNLIPPEELTKTVMTCYRRILNKWGIHGPFADVIRKLEKIDES